MTDQSLAAALKDIFSDPVPPPAALPGTEPLGLEKPIHLDSFSLEEKAEINARADVAKAERQKQIAKLQVAKEQAYYRQLCESQMAPVNATGRPAITFLADLKKVFAPPTPICLAEHPDFLQMSAEERATFLLASPEYVDWPRTYMLRQTFLDGFEKKKSARPGRALGHVSDQEIMEHVEKLLNPSATPIRGNRFVHSEKGSDAAR